MKIHGQIQRLLALIISFNMIFLSIPLTPLNIQIPVLSIPLAHSCTLDLGDDKTPTTDPSDDTGEGDTTPTDTCGSTCPDGPLSPSGTSLTVQNAIDVAETVVTSANSYRQTLNPAAPTKTTVNRLSGFTRATLLSYKTGLTNVVGAGNTLTTNLNTQQTNLTNLKTIYNNATDTAALEAELVKIRGTDGNGGEKALVQTKISNFNKAIGDTTDQIAAFDAASMNLLVTYLGYSTTEAMSIREGLVWTATGNASSGVTLRIEFHQNIYDYTATKSGTTWTVLLNQGQRAAIRVMNYLISQGASLADLGIFGANEDTLFQGFYDVVIAEAGTAERETIFYFSENVPPNNVTSPVSFSKVQYGFQICFGGCSRVTVAFEAPGAANGALLSSGVNYYALEKVARDLISGSNKIATNGNYVFTLGSFENVDEIISFFGNEVTIKRHSFHFENAVDLYGYDVAKMGTVYSSEIRYKFVNDTAGRAKRDLAKRLRLAKADSDVITVAQVAGFTLTLRLYEINYHYNSFPSPTEQSRARIEAVKNLKNRGVSLRNIRLEPQSVEVSGSTFFPVIVLRELNRPEDANMVYQYSTAGDRLFHMTYLPASGAVINVYFQLIVPANFDPRALEFALRDLLTREPAVDSTQIDLTSYSAADCSVVPCDRATIALRTAEGTYTYQVDYIFQLFNSRYEIVSVAFSSNFTIQSTYAFGSGRLAVGVRANTNGTTTPMVKIEFPTPGEFQPYRTVASYNIDAGGTIFDASLNRLTVVTSKFATVDNEIIFNLNGATFTRYQYAVATQIPTHRITERFKLGNSGDENELRKLSHLIIEKINTPDEFPVQDINWTYDDATGALLTKSVSRIGRDLRSMVYTQNFNPPSSTVKVTRLGGGNDCPDNGSPIRICSVTVVEFELGPQAGPTFLLNGFDDEGLLYSVTGETPAGESFGVRYGANGIEYWSSNIVADAAKNFLQSFIRFPTNIYTENYWWVQNQDALSRMEVISFIRPVTNPPQPADVYDVRLRFLGQEFTIRMNVFNRAPSFVSAANESTAALTAVKQLLLKQVNLDNIQIQLPITASSGGYRVNVFENHYADGPDITHHFFVRFVNGQWDVKELGADYHMPDGTRTFQVSFCSPLCDGIDIQGANFPSSNLDKIYDAHAILRGIQLISSKVSGTGNIAINLREYQERRGDSPMGFYDHYQYELESQTAAYGIALYSHYGAWHPTVASYQAPTLLYEFAHTPLNRAKDALADMLNLSLQQRSDIQDGPVNGTSVTVSLYGNQYTFIDQIPYSNPMPATMAAINAINERVNGHGMHNGQWLTFPEWNFPLATLTFNHSDITPVSDRSGFYHVRITETRAGKPSIIHHYESNGAVAAADIDGPFNPINRLAEKTGIRYLSREIDFNVDQFANGVIIGKPPGISVGTGIDETEYDARAITAVMDDLSQKGELDSGSGTSFKVVSYIFKTYGESIVGDVWWTYEIQIQNLTDGVTYKYEVRHHNFTGYTVTPLETIFPEQQLRFAFQDGEVVIVAPEHIDHWIALIRVPADNTLGLRTFAKFDVRPCLSPACNLNAMPLTLEYIDGQEWQKIIFHVNTADHSQDFYEKSRRVEHRLPNGALQYFQEIDSFRIVKFIGTRVESRIEKRIQNTDGSVIQRTINSLFTGPFQTYRYAGGRTLIFKPLENHVKVLETDGAVIFEATIAPDPVVETDGINFPPQFEILSLLSGVTETGKLFEINVGATIEVTTEEQLAGLAAKRDLEEKYGIPLAPVVTVTEVSPWNSCSGWPLQHKDCTGQVEGRSYSVELSVFGNTFVYHSHVNNEFEILSVINPGQEAAIAGMKHLSARYDVPISNLSFVSSIGAPLFGGTEEASTEYWYRYPMIFTNASTGHTWEYTVKQAISKSTGDVRHVMWGVTHRGAPTEAGAEGIILDKIYFRHFSTRELDVRVSPAFPLAPGSVDWESIDMAFNQISGTILAHKLTENDRDLHIRSYVEKTTNVCTTATTCDNISFLLAGQNWIYAFDDITREMLPGPIYRHFQYVPVTNDWAGNAKLELAKRLGLDFDTMNAMQVGTVSGSGVSRTVPLTLYGTSFVFTVTSAGSVNNIPAYLSQPNGTTGTVIALINNWRADAEKYWRPTSMDKIFVEADTVNSEIRLRETGLTGGVSLTHRYDLNGSRLKGLIFRDSTGADTAVTFDFLTPAALDSHAVLSAVKDLISKNIRFSSYILRDYTERLGEDIMGNPNYLSTFKLDAAENNEEARYEFSVLKRFGSPAYQVTSFSTSVNYEIRRQFALGIGRVLIAVTRDAAGAEQWAVKIQAPGATAGSFVTIRHVPIAAVTGDLNRNPLTVSILNQPWTLTFTDGQDFYEAKQIYPAQQGMAGFDDIWQIRFVEHDGNHDLKRTLRKIVRNGVLIQETDYEWDETTETVDPAIAANMKAVEIRRHASGSVLTYEPETGRLRVDNPPFDIAGSDLTILYDGTFPSDAAVLQSIEGITEEGERFSARVVNNTIVVFREKDLAEEQSQILLKAMLTDWISDPARKTAELNLITQNLVTHPTQIMSGPWDGCFGWELPGQTCGDSKEGRAYSVALELFGNHYRFHVLVDNNVDFQIMIDPAMEAAIEAINNIRARVPSFQLSGISNIRASLDPSRNSVPADPLLHRYAVSFEIGGNRWQYDILRYFDPVTNGLNYYRFRGIKHLDPNDRLLEAVYFSLHNTKHAYVDYRGYPDIHEDSIEDVIRFNVFNAWAQTPRLVLPDLVRSVQLFIDEYSAESITDCATHPNIRTVGCEQVNFVLRSNAQVIQGTGDNYSGHTFIAETRRTVWATQLVFDQVQFVGLAHSNKSTAKMLLRREFGLTVNQVRSITDSDVQPPAPSDFNLSLYGIYYKFSSTGGVHYRDDATAAVVAGIKHVKQMAAQYYRNFDLSKISAPTMNVSFDFNFPSGGQTEVQFRESVNSGEYTTHTYIFNGRSSFRLSGVLFKFPDLLGGYFIEWSAADGIVTVDAYALRRAVAVLVAQGLPGNFSNRLTLRNYVEANNGLLIDGGLSTYMQFNFTLESSSTTYVFETMHWISYLWGPIGEPYTSTLLDQHPLTASEFVDRVTEYSAVSLGRYYGLVDSWQGAAFSSAFPGHQTLVQYQMPAEQRQLLIDAVNLGLSLDEALFRQFMKSIDLLFILPWASVSAFALYNPPRVLGLTEASIDDFVNQYESLFGSDGFAAELIDQYDVHEALAQNILVTLAHESRHILSDEADLFNTSTFTGRAMDEQTAFLEGGEWMMRLPNTNFPWTWGNVGGFNQWLGERMEDALIEGGDPYTGIYAHYLLGELNPETGLPFDAAVMQAPYASGGRALMDSINQGGNSLTWEDLAYVRGHKLNLIERINRGISAERAYSIIWEINGQEYEVVADQAGNVYQILAVGGSPLTIAAAKSVPADAFNGFNYVLNNLHHDSHIDLEPATALPGMIQEGPAEEGTMQEGTATEAALAPVDAPEVEAESIPVPTPVVSPLKDLLKIQLPKMFSRFSGISLLRSFTLSPSLLTQSTSSSQITTILDQADLLDAVTATLSLDLDAETGGSAPDVEQDTPPATGDEGLKNDIIPLVSYQPFYTPLVFSTIRLDTRYATTGTSIQSTRKNNSLTSPFRLIGLLDAFKWAF